MKTALSILAIMMLAIGLVSCNKAGEEKAGYGKDDFKKTGPPPGWKGPGQPGGPATGPSTPPPPSSDQNKTESK